MMELLQKRNIIVVLFVIALGIVFSLSYTYLIRPKASELLLKKTQLTQDKLLLETVQARLKKQEGVMQSTQGLQRKLPVKPLIDQYLLDLEKAELLSGSTLQNIGITNTEVTGGSQANAAQASAVQTTDESSGSNADQTGSQEQPAQQAPAAGQPELAGIKQLTFGLSVNSPNYEDMLSFVGRLEGMERISRIDSFQFSSGSADASQGEGASAASSTGLNFTVSVSTFYESGMNGLDNELPWVEYPKPAGKKTPLEVGR
ncbi:hypothetical protein [Paenibacillus albus]|uniref:Pilus assembly protein PilO n=1 Tax=Paenibacillus albus TaxID=2495582 RepID=A0A3S9ACE4_9BACL|nr:hypothetical protein [Paenibacillus albus]AZN43336.1 hypothetical protein EJC50_29340 [Paenibacillus albus]